MANTKISALSSLATMPAGGDLFVIVDVSDTTHAASGTTKKIRFDTFVSSGNWTPTISGTSTAGSHTYSVQVGRYIKIGTLVIASFNVAINTKDGAMAGNAQISGLPFTTKNLTNFGQAGSIAFWTSLATSIVHASIFANVNLITAALYKATAAATGVSAMVAADFQNGSQLLGSVVYEADA